MGDEKGEVRKERGEMRDEKRERVVTVAISLTKN